MADKRSIVFDNESSAAVPVTLEITPSAAKAPPPQTHMTIMAFAKQYGLKMIGAEASGHGRALTRLSRSHNLVIRQIPDDRWGTVHAYDVEMLKSYFKVS